MRYWVAISVCLLIGVLGVRAQSERKYIRQGNELYRDGQLDKAEEKYNEALEEKTGLVEGNFNLGNVYHQKKDYEVAARQFEAAAQTATTDEVKAKAYHNMGNTLVEAKKYQEGIEAYKNALRLNPKDMDTKYNLAYASSLLQQQQKQQQQDDKKGENEKEQNKSQEANDTNDKKEQSDDQKDGKNEQEGEEGKSDKKESDPAEDNDNQSGAQPEPKEGQLSKEEAERMLEALKNEEKKVQERIFEKKADKAGSRKIEKDW